MAGSGITFNPDRFKKDQWRFHAFLITLTVFMGSPLIFVFNHAFKPYSELFAYPPKFFVRRPTLENFLRLATFSRESGILRTFPYCLNFSSKTKFILPASLKSLH